MLYYAGKIAQMVGDGFLSDSGEVCKKHDVSKKSVLLTS
jgi:hypothetical protein